MKGLAHNAAWNVATGLSSSLLTLALPPILVRIIDGASFSAWIVALQIANYVTILNLGAQTVIARHIAAVNARNDRRARDVVTATSFAVLLGMASVELLAVSGLAVTTPWLFPEAPVAMQASMAITIFLLALGLAIQLPVSTFGAVFVGLQRNDINSLGMITMRCLLMAGIVAAALMARDIRVMALGWVVGSLIATVVIVTMWRRNLEQPRLSLCDTSAGEARRFLIDSGPFLIWNLSYLVVTGLQVIVVGRFAYGDVVYFATAAGFATFLPGIQQAITGPLVARISHNLATDDIAGIRRSLGQITLIGVLLSTMLATAMIAGADVIMRMTLDQLYIPKSGLILALVTLAMMVRNLLMAYVTAAVACRLDRHLLANPVVEALVAISLSLLLTPIYGAVGAAAAMLTGGIVLNLLQLRQNPLRRKVPGFAVLPYVLNLILRPAAGMFVAAVGFVILYRAGVLGLAPATILGAVALTTTLVLNRARLIDLARRGSSPALG